MKKIILFQIIIMILQVNAQTDSIKEALKYYPLHIGDYWQYRATRHSYGGIEKDSSWISYKEVISDTVMSNGKKYFIIRQGSISSTYLLNLSYVRIDSAKAVVYEYVTFFNSDNKIDSLLVKKGDRFMGKICVTDTIQMFLGYSVNAKLMKDYLISDTYYDGWEFAYGFGEVMRYYDDIFTYWIHYQNDIIYAKIDGKEYGIKANVQKSEYLPEQIKIFQNYPNPFNPFTKIKYTLSKSGWVTLKVYDLLGNEIAILVNQEKMPGSYECIFDASKFSSGVYFYRLQFDNFIQTKKLVLLK